MVVVTNLWHKGLPTTSETPLTRCSQLHANGRDANTCHQKQQQHESKGLLKCASEVQEALRQGTSFICTAANILKPKEFSNL